jgi:hypothetical protein
MHFGIRPALLFGLLSAFFHERKKQKQKNRTLSENIVKFFEYFGVGILSERTIRYCSNGKYEIVQEGQSSGPFAFLLGNVNIAHPLMRDFLAVLKNRYRVISNYNFDQEQSIIGALVNPCQKAFGY